MPELRFSSDFNPSVFSEELFQEIRQVIDDEMLDAATELQRESPVGATRQLKDGWDIVPAKRRANSFEVRGSIVNRADKAADRIRGHGPGTTPEAGPLKAWVRAKISSDPRRVNSIAYLVARKIAREGTDRWRDGDGNNFAGLKRDDSVTDSSPIARASDRISARLDRLEFPKRKSRKRRAK